MKNLRLCFRLYALCVLLLLCCCDSVREPVKAGFLYLNTVGDVGWTFSHEQARQQLIKDDCISAAPYLELVVPFDNDSVAASLEQLVQQDCDIIFSTSFDFMDQTGEVAQAHQDVCFMHCAGYKTAENMGNYFGRMYQADYLIGLMAGEVSRSGSVGYVAPVRIPEVYRGINAFTLGVREQNPHARVYLAWVGDWYDPPEASRLAEELVAAGVDVLAHGQDSPAVNQVAEKHAVPSFGYNTDMYAYAPNSHLTAAVWNWAVFYSHYCKMVYDGQWQPEEAWWGFERDAVRLAPFSSLVPEDLAGLVEGRIGALKEAEHSVFTGPIYDNEGLLQYSEDEHATDEELLGMDYLVQGITEL